MAMIELTLSLDLTSLDRASEARVFVDFEPEQGLSSEIEVPLWPDGEHQWRGLFSVDEARCEDFTYRIGLFGQQNAQWSLLFRDCGRGTELLSDCDRMVASKGWLIGTCGTSPAAHHAGLPTAVASGDRRGRATPRLRLIRGGA